MVTMRRKTGFTLIELIVVLAIIGLLASIVAPRYVRTVDNAREASLKTSLNVMRDAIDKYRADTGRYPESLDDLVDRRYLRRVPPDPITERNDSWVIVSPPDEPGQRKVWDVQSGAEGQGRDGSEYRTW